MRWPVHGAQARPLKAARSAAAAPARCQPPPATRSGIDFDFYWYRDMNVGAGVRADTVYAKSLARTRCRSRSRCGAPAAAVPPPGRTTPPPGALRQAIRRPGQAGLAVYLRPLVGEGNVGVRPDPVRRHGPAGAWFRRYQTFLLPYAADGAAHGSRRDLRGRPSCQQFATVGNWAALDAALRHDYYGQLYGSAKLVRRRTSTRSGGTGVPPATVAVDAYKPMPVPPDGFGARLDWTAGCPRDRGNRGRHPAGRGAGRRPIQVARRRSSTRGAARWFTAACRAAQAGHLGGIYFWSIGLGGSGSTARRTCPTVVGRRPGAQAIKAASPAGGHQMEPGGRRAMTAVPQGRRARCGRRAHRTKGGPCCRSR